MNLSGLPLLRHDGGMFQSQDILPITQSDPDRLASLRGRIGALALHATRDGRSTTEKARAAFMSRFAREVDPDGLLSSEERCRRAGYAKRRYFQTLALKSAKARRRKGAA